MYRERVKKGGYLYLTQTQASMSDSIFNPTNMVAYQPGWWNTNKEGGRLYNIYNCLLESLLWILYTA